MKKAFYLSLLFVLTTSVVWAQGSIKGTVMIRTDEPGKQEKVEPLVAATVFVTWGGERIYTRTNNHGDYILRPLEPGTYNVTIASSLIDTVVIPEIHVSGTETAFAPLITANAGVTLGQVIVFGGEKPLAEESPAKMQLRKSDIEKLPNFRNFNEVISMFGGAYVSDNGRQISFRGARIGDALYIIDGVRQRSTDVSLPGRAIGSITAWNGGVPAQYGDFMGGVVVIETMSYFDWENQQEVKYLIAKRQAQEEQFRKEMEERHQKIDDTTPSEVEEELQEPPVEEL
jgi:hypothetical protein